MEIEFKKAVTIDEEDEAKFIIEYLQERGIELKLDTLELIREAQYEYMDKLGLIHYEDNGEEENNA